MFVCTGEDKHLVSLLLTPPPKKMEKSFAWKYYFALLCDSLSKKCDMNCKSLLVVKII